MSKIRDKTRVISTEHSVKFTYSKPKRGEKDKNIITITKQTPALFDFKPGDICVIREDDKDSYKYGATNAILGYPIFIVKRVIRGFSPNRLTVIIADEKTGTSLIMLKSTIHVTKTGFDQTTIIHSSYLTKIGEI